MSGKGKQNNHNRTKKLNYVISAAALAALVAAAFFSPRWVFGIQDNRQCNDMTLEKRENAAVAALSTNYETSFYQRMVNFAENQSNHTNYYVTSEELTDYQKLREFLYTENGFYRDNILVFLDMNLVSEDIFQYDISKWKQYVIYSDDYTKGVNFIMWYIELEHPDEAIGTLKLLLEANTGEFYGLQADTGGQLIRYDKVSRDYHISLNEFLGISSIEEYQQAWETLAYFYSGLTETSFFQCYNYAMGYGLVNESVRATNYSDFEEAALQAELENMWEEWADYSWRDARLESLNGGNRLEGAFPYGEGSLSFRLEMQEDVSYPWTLRNLTIGFPAIYSMIPEFNE